MRRLFPLLFLAASLPAADIDNEFVHAIKAVQHPHVRGPMHSHQFNRVMIYQDAADLIVTHEDGSQEVQHWKAGQVAWAPVGGKHTSENVGDGPIRLVEVEIKKPAPAAPPVRNPALDPIAIDPEHNILIFENPQVRVFRSWREPGATEKMHEHPAPGRLAVLLTDLDARVKSADGAIATQHAAAGDVVWSGPVTHATTNSGSHRFEMVVIEVK